MNNKWYLVIVIAVSILVHLVFYGHPNQVVFDEVHFGGFVSNYYDNSYFFDIHPPLGKLMIAGFAKFFDFRPEYSFAQIGTQFPDNKYLALRFLPTLAGILFPIVFFLLLLELGISRTGAFVGGILMSLENAFLVESKFILMDMFLLIFGLTALLMYLKFRNTKLAKYIWLAGIFGGLALSIKWTGVGFLALPFLFELVRLFRQGFSKSFFGVVLALMVVPFIIYFLIFAIHFKVLNRTGPGDGFMSPEFQKTLDGSRYNDNDQIKAISLPKKFIETNTEMYRANQRLTATHPYSSPWYSWPLMARGVYFWTNGEGSRIYLLGNPIIWWASSLGIVALLLFLVLRQEKLAFVNSFLAIGYISNMLPFVGIKRVMFLYHYLPAMVFAVIALIYLIEQNKKSRLIYGTLLLSALIAFIYFAPFSYGLPLSDAGYDHRMWFNSWP